MLADHVGNTGLRILASFFEYILCGQGSQGIGEEKAKLMVDEEDRDEIVVELENEGKWEEEVGFVPQKAGRQKVEFVLYKEGEPYFGEPLHLWINIDEP